MGMVIGIDVGGSTTKIIGVDKEGIKTSYDCKSRRSYHFVIRCFRQISYMIMESA